MSIAKLGCEQGRYYVDGAHGRVDAVDSIGGAEDYYGEGGAAPNAWIGAGARRLGMAGPVSSDELRWLLEGCHPGTRELLRKRLGPLTNAAIDLTFSAPKSVSVLFGVGGPAIEAAVRRAHDRAVEEALCYMDRHAAAVRRGRNGVRVLSAEGFVGAAFRHRTSRAGDPQLHTHVVVANMALGPDGRWTALDGRRIYAHAGVAGCLYQAVLRGELTRELGLAWTPVRDGIAEVVGVPEAVRRRFSRCRVEIEAALEEHGTSGPHAAEAAALATRRRKDRGVDPQELRRSWLDRAAALGFGLRQIDALQVGYRAPELNGRRTRDIFAWLARPNGLTAESSTFSEADVIATIAGRLAAGSLVNGRRLERLARGFLETDQVVPLASRADEQRNRRWTTIELLRVAAELVALAVTRQCAGRGIAGGEALTRALDARPSLTTEQLVAVRHLVLDGGGVAVVVGVAGAGKTYALGAAADAWLASGLQVRGAAVARRAARELENGSGIPSTSVAALLAELDRGPSLARGTVLVVDEAGMAGTRQLARVAAAVDAVAGKLVLVGDDRQLDAIEAGGAFRGLVNRGLAIELSENRRQEQAWERDAARELRDGDPQTAIDAYRRHDRVLVTTTDHDARERLAADWWHGSRRGDVVMIARSRSDVADLNRRARDRMRSASALGDDELRCAAGRLAAGDQVMVRRNLPDHGLANGDRGTVRHVDPVRMRIAVEVEGRVVVGLGGGVLLARTARGDPVLQHGCAITGHSAKASPLSALSSSPAARSTVSGSTRR